MFINETTVKLLTIALQNIEKSQYFKDNLSTMANVSQVYPLTINSDLGNEKLILVPTKEREPVVSDEVGMETKEALEYLFDSAHRHLRSPMGDAQQFIKTLETLGYQVSSFPIHELADRPMKRFLSTPRYYVKLSIGVLPI